MFNDTFFDHHHHQYPQGQQQQASWCSPAHFTSEFFQQQQSSSGFQPGSFTTPSSFGTSSLARMESTFCKNFVCCSIPLDDLHDLLEHYEQAHCHQSSPPTAPSDASTSNQRADLVVFEDEDEWSGTESASTHPSTRPGFDRGRSPPENWPISSPTSKDPSNHSRRNHHTTDHWVKNEEGFGIPPSLLDGQNTLNRSADPNRFLMMIDGDEDGSSAVENDRNPDSQSDFAKKRRLASEQSDWDFTREKPYKCSVPGCEKAYKQPNGLKYHQTHGHCSQKTSTIEDEPKTFVCHDAVCGKRYKNVNGLRYHYQHSGPHGAIGLQLLSLGLHPSGPTLNMSNLDTNNHPHRHPLLTSIGSSCTSGTQGGSVSGLASEDGDVVMDDQ